MKRKMVWMKIEVKAGFAPTDRIVLFDSVGFSKKVSVRVPSALVDDQNGLVCVDLVEMSRSQALVTFPNNCGTYKVERDLITDRRSGESPSLRFVTVTGADDSVDPDKLLDLAAKYPLAEFGILVGNHSSVERFPSFSWICALQDAIERRREAPRLSCHLCGHWVSEFLTSKHASIPFWDKLLWGRVQINTHGEAHPVVLGHLHMTLQTIGTMSGGSVEVIFQRDRQNDLIFDYLKLAGKCMYNVSTLFDTSHGAGALPTEWPPAIEGARCGYAGGLSPANVAAELDKIATVAGDSPFWIDAETKLRSEDGEVFDLVKVEQFLAGASAWNTLNSCLSE